MDAMLTLLVTPAENVGWLVPLSLGFCWVSRPSCKEIQGLLTELFTWRHAVLIADYILFI